MPNIEHYCSWCKKLISTETSEDVSEDIQTHGMCEKCELENLEHRIPIMEAKMLEFRDKELDDLADTMEEKLNRAQSRVKELEDILSLEEVPNLEEAADDALSPVALMRLTQIDDPDELLKDHDRDDIVIEEKLDGWKTQVIKKGGEIKIYSRRGEDKTENFPDLVAALKNLPDGTLVEGELVYWNNGKQDVGKVTSLAGSNPETSLKKAKELPGTMKIHLYDILWLKGKNVTKEPFSKRRKLLQSTIKGSEKVQITKQYPFSEWQKAMNAAVDSGGEGIVLKIKDKEYEYKDKGENEPKPKDVMFKYKGGIGKSDSDDYVVYDYETSDKGNLKALFGQYYKGKLYHISEISNFSEENEKKVKEKLEKGNFVIEIGFQERVPGGLRHQKFVRFRDDKKPKDATMNEFHSKNIDEFKVVKSASFLLSKRAAYADSVLEILEEASSRLFPMTEFKNVPQVSGINFPAIFYLVSKLESSGKTHLIGDAGNSFGLTQVHGPYFMRYLAQNSRAQQISGISSQEFKQMASSWLNARHSMKSVWNTVSVDEAEARAYMAQHPNDVIHRKEGTTIRNSPTNAPGIIQVRRNRFVGYVINIDKLQQMGLEINNTVLDRLNKITKTFITWGVANSAISKLFIAQTNPVAYAKFQRTFSSSNIKKDPALKQVLDNISVTDFMSKVKMVLSDVNRFGYDTTAPGAYSIYQLAFIANASGAGAVRNFLRTRRPLAAGNIHYIQSSRFMRAMKWIQRDPKAPSDVQQIASSLLSGLPPSGGLEGFVRSKVASLVLSKRADEEIEDFEEEITTAPESTHDVEFLIKMRDEFISGLQGLMNESGTVRERIWSTLAERTKKPDLEAEDITKLYVEDVMNYLLQHFEEIKEKLEKDPQHNPFVDYMLSNWYVRLVSPKPDLNLKTTELPKVSTQEIMFFKRANYVEPGTLYFPAQYAESIKSGKRSMTIRANDVPVLPEEIVRCMTYSGGLICEVKITSKNTMSINRIGKAYGDRIAKSLSKKFGPNGRFVVIKFEPTDNINVADDDDDEKKMSEVLIDEDKKLTRGQIKDHYSKPAVRKKIMSRIKDKPVLVYIGTGTNEKILKRNHNGKEIVITNDDPKGDESPNNYFYWVKRRVLSFHQVFGTKTSIGFVDLDIHGDYPLSDAKKYAKALSAKIKDKYGSTGTIFESGGSGLHVEFKLSSEMSIDKLRGELKELLTDLNEDWKDVTTGIVKGSGMRSDISTLHNKGSIRVPGSFGESNGNIKKALGAEQDTLENNFNSGGFGKLYTQEMTEPFPDALLQVPPMIGVEPVGSYVAYNTVDDKLASIEKAAGQTYVNEDMSYSVDMLIEITADNKIEEVLIDTLLWNMDEKIWGENSKKHSPAETLENPKKYKEDSDRIKEVDLKHPILIYKGEVIDGYHRLAKAVSQNKKKVRVRIVTDKQLDATRIDKERIKELSKKSILMLVAPQDLVKYDAARRILMDSLNLTTAFDVISNDYDALFVAGGAEIINERSKNLVRSFIRQKKPIAMIDRGPLLAVEAGVVRGREITGCQDIVGKIRRANGIWTGMPIERDGLLFTAIGPDDAENLAYILANFLNKETTSIPTEMLDQKSASALLNKIWKFADDLSDEDELAKLMREQQEDIEEETGEEEEFTPERQKQEIKRQKDLETQKYKEVIEEPTTLEPEEPRPPKAKREKRKGFKDIIFPEEEEEELSKGVGKLPSIDKEEDLETSEDFEAMMASSTEDLAMMFSAPVNFGDEVDEVPLESDEEEDYESTMEKSPETIFGVKLEPPKDKNGEILDRWFSKEDAIKVPQMSSEAKKLFSVKNLRDGNAINKVFQDPTAWEILHTEPQLLQSWILPSLIMGIGKRWFDNNSGRITLGTKKFKNVGKTPFGMFDEDDIAMIADGASIEDLISGRKYIRMVNQLITKYANYYFSYGYRQSERDPRRALPISGYMYKSLSRAMTKEIAEIKGYREKRYPVCSVCKAKQKNDKMTLASMKKVAEKPDRWECPTCHRLHGEIQNIEIPTIEANVSRHRMTLLGTKDRMGVEERLRIAKHSLEIAESEEDKAKIQARIDKDMELSTSAKSAITVLEEKKAKFAQTQAVLAGQLAVPYWHAWCPNPTCPGRKVPLTAIDWKSDIWRQPGGAELVARIQTQYGVSAPSNLKLGKGSLDAATFEEESEKTPEGRKVTSANMPPIWMLNVPFICPHDNVKFTLGETRYKGHRNMGGFLWEPYRRMEWDKTQEATSVGEFEIATQAAGAEEEMDSRLSKTLFAYLSVLGKKSLSREISGKEEEFHSWVDKQVSRGYTVERILKSKDIRNKLRDIELYRTVDETSSLDPLSFVSWLTETSVGSKFVQDAEKDIGEENFILKTTKEQRRDEIYVPILQSWTDGMLAKPNGFEKFGMEEILTNRKIDGIPSDGPGTFFIAKIGDDILPPRGKEQEGIFGFKCGLKLLTKKEGTRAQHSSPSIVPDSDEDGNISDEALIANDKMSGDDDPFADATGEYYESWANASVPLRTSESSFYPRILRVIGMWQLSGEQVTDIELQEVGHKKLNGTLYLERKDTLIQHAKANSDQNIVRDLTGHDFYRAELDKDNTELSVGDYVLVQALLMPGAYKWNPIIKVQELRRKSDTAKNIFGRLGALFSESTGKVEDRKLLQEFVRDIKEYGDDPKEMEMIVDDLIDKFEAERGKTVKSSFNLSIRQAKDPLSKYKKKREFDETPEPEGEVSKKNKHRFVIQRHKADRAGEHFDLRLENDDGAMSSWALPKHKLPKGKEKLLAVKTEDHPISYNKFEGEIPEGEYGAGVVEIYDSGTYEEVEAKDSKIVFKFKGKKEKGTYKIFKTDGNKWMIMEENNDKEGSGPLSLIKCAKKHTGAMLAIVAPADIVKKMRKEKMVEDKEIYDILHLTLLYLGDLNKTTIDAIKKATERVCVRHKPLEMYIAGAGIFTPGDDGTPVYVVPNAKGLSALQADLESSIGNIIDLPSEHGWVPHMTVSYSDDDNPDLPEIAGEFKWTADKVRLQVGGKKVADILIGGKKKEAFQLSSRGPTLLIKKYQNTHLAK